MTSLDGPAAVTVQHFMAEFYAQNALDYELYLWARERHGLQAAYAPLVSEAGPAE